MNFNGNIKHLDGFNLDHIKEWVLHQEEALWNEITFRQKTYKTHNYTQSLFLLYKQGDYDIKNHDFLSSFISDIQNIQQKVIETVSNDKLKFKRIIAPRLKGHGFIRRHVDSGDFLTTHWRCHFPLLTNERVNFFVGDEEINMKKNNGYIINNQRLHGVSNNSPLDRYHLIIDFGE